jgi:hypothetical protein
MAAISRPPLSPIPLAPAPGANSLAQEYAARVPESIQTVLSQ